MTQVPPAVALKALTLEAQSALHGQQKTISRFPFRVGRENRGPDAHWTRTDSDRRQGHISPTNDLYLWEKEEHIHVSRNHFEIVREGSDFFLVDRESTLGTWVEGQLVGGQRRGGRVKLQSGFVIIVGSHQAGFIFKFVVLD